jgi:type I restriction enzyme, S subunit
MSKESKNMIVPKLRFPEFRDNGEWKVNPLKDIAVELKEKVGNESYKLMSITSGVGLVSQIEKFGREIAGESVKNYLIINKGDFAYNKSSTKLYPEGEIAMLENEENGAVPNSIFTCFRFNPEYIIPCFVKYPFLNNIHGRWLRSFIAVGARANGALQVNSKDLFSLLISYPELPEQQKIASCLSSLNDLITAENQKLDALKAHKKGLMQQLFPAEGEKVPKLRFAEFRGSGEWEEKKLGDVIEIKGRIGYRGYTIEDIVDKGEGAISLSPSNFNDGSLVFEKSTYISWEKYEESPEIMLNEGYTVLVKTGSSFGKAAFVNKLYEKVTINPQIVVLKPFKIHDFFLFLLVSNTSIQNQIKKAVVGGAIPTLSQHSISKLKIFVPSIKEQQKIASCLSSLDELIKSQTEKIEALKEHKKGLMQGLFPKG